MRLNKRHLEIEELASKLRPVTEKQQKMMEHSLFPKTWYRLQSKTKHICMECGCEYSSTSNKVEVCPKCGKRNHPCKKQPDMDIKYFAILEAVGDYQVIRYFIAKRFYKHNRSYIQIPTEVCQMWEAEDGFETARALSFIPFSYYIRDPWAYGSGFHFRSTQKFSQGYCVDSDVYNFMAKVYVRSLLPVIEKYGGYRENAQGVLDTIRLLLRSPHHATLYETGQMEVFGHVGMHHLNEAPEEGMPTVWEMVKVCTRHDYTIKDYSIWLDIMKMQKGKDLHSPHYLCIPENEIMRIHDRMERRRRREEEIRNKLAGYQSGDKKLQKQAERAYRSLIGKGLLAVCIKMDDVVIKPLQSVKEFYDEGNAMSHCVYTNGYWKKPDCLILSARRGKKRLATIELDGTQFRIRQCRGPHNSIPKLDSEIRAAITKNMTLFQRAKAKELTL